MINRINILDHVRIVHGLFRGQTGIVTDIEDDGLGVPTYEIELIRDRTYHTFYNDELELLPDEEGESYV